MATDIQDWTSAVRIESGTVSITGIASVSISNTPSVIISGTPSVSVSGTPTVQIGNTPAVTISGTPTVILGGGTASIGSVSAIGSTVTVAGTVNIGNTPAVTINSGNVTASISGTPNVNIASQSGNLNVVFPSTQNVSIVGTATVAISGTPTVTISGTPSVSISGTPTVILGGGTASIGSISAIGSTVTVAGTISIGNTPSVTITSGTVNIGNTPSVNINLGAVDQTVSGSLNADFANNGGLAMAGLAGVGCSFDGGGNLIGTVQAWVSFDGAVTYPGRANFVDPLTGNTFTSLVNPGGAGYAIAVPAGASHVTLVVHPYISGAVTARLRGTGGVATPQILIAGTPNVTISGTPSVSISGTPTVNIGNTPSVTVSGTASVNIANTPAVTISGTPTVILGGGTASIGSISAIGSTVTVAGTVNIGNTPSVTISGTPTVNIGNTPAVTISGVAAININSQSVNLNTQQPQTSLGNFAVAAGPATNNATYNLPAGTHAVGIAVKSPGLDTLQVQGVTSGVNYINLTGMVSATGYFVSPVLSVLDTQVKVTATTATGVGPTTLYSVAILDAEGVFIFDNTHEPASVFLTDTNGGAWGTAAFVGGQQANAQSAPVVVASGQMPALTPTYRAGHNYGPAFAGFSLWLVGSATKLIKIYRIRLGISAAASAQVVLRMMRTTTLTGGTIATTYPTQTTLAAMYLPDPSSTLAIREYSAAPTPGSQGEISTRRTLAPAGAVAVNELVWDFADSPGRKPLTLNGTSDFIGIETAGLNGVTWEIDWTEE